MMNRPRIPTAGNLADLAILAEILKTLTDPKAKLGILDEVAAQLAETQAAAQLASDKAKEAGDTLAENTKLLVTLDAQIKKAEKAATAAEALRNEVAGAKAAHNGKVAEFERAVKTFESDSVSRAAVLTAREKAVSLKEEKAATTLAAAEAFEAEYREKLAKLKVLTG
jgi:hypothetical protein